MPEQGQRLPDVEFIAESGERLAAGDLAGSKTVLYFYPKGDTPGCTKEDYAFRDRIPDYEEANVRGYGVSLDSPESHRRFRKKHGLNFPLLTDEDGRASEALGARDERGYSNRVTFLLDPEGKIANVYPEVSLETHADDILRDATIL